MNPTRAGVLQPADDSTAGNETTATAIVVFALDDALPARLRAALPRVTIHAADTVADLADLLVAKPCRALGVEVAALGAGANELLARFAGLFPDLPLVALGSAHDARAVAPLLASGEVHAFLARPIDAEAAREAFEAAFRRNAALTRSADLRRAAALRRSSTFLVHESRADEGDALRTTRAVAQGASAEPRRPYRAIAAVAALLLGVLGVATWFALDRTSHVLPESGGHGATASHAPTPPAPSDATRTAERSALARATALTEAAEQALVARRFDDADAQARAAAALGHPDPTVAERLAAVLDGVAADRRARERAAVAEAQWARAAREWARMRAAETTSAAPSDSRTSEASPDAPPPTDPDAAG